MDLEKYISIFEKVLSDVKPITPPKNTVLYYPILWKKKIGQKWELRKLKWPNGDVKYILYRWGTWFTVPGVYTGPGEVATITITEHGPMLWGYHTHYLDEFVEEINVKEGLV